MNSILKFAPKGIAHSGRSGDNLHLASYVRHHLQKTELTGITFLINAKGLPQATAVLAFLLIWLYQEMFGLYSEIISAGLS